MEQYTSFEDVFVHLRENSCEKEHNVVTWIKSVPKGRHYESCHALEKGCSLSWLHETSLYVELQPEVDLVVPSAKQFNDRSAQFYVKPIGADYFVPLIVSVVAESACLDCASSKVEGTVVKESPNGHSKISVFE